MKLETDIDSLGISLDTLMLSPDGGEVAAHIAAMLRGSIWGGRGVKSSSCYKMRIAGSMGMGVQIMNI